MHHLRSSAAGVILIRRGKVALIISMEILAAVNRHASRRQRKSEAVDRRRKRGEAAARLPTRR